VPGIAAGPADVGFPEREVSPDGLPECHGSRISPGGFHSFWTAPGTGNPGPGRYYSLGL
jgi:hypothetical protein